MFLELSIRSARNCLAPSLFSAKFQTTEQLVTCGTATMVLDPLSGGVTMIFLATSGSCFSAARKRLMALIVHRSEEHTSELQSRGHLVCRLLLEKKKPRARIRPVVHIAH